jgi:hypothetical protein
MGQKYNLFYACARWVAGERIVGYDDERGKGDHKHIRGYAYRDMPTLIRDFLLDIEETES